MVNSSRFCGCTRLLSQCTREAQSSVWKCPSSHRFARQAARNAVSLRRSTVGALPYSPDERLRRTSASLQVASACPALCSELQTSCMHPPYLDKPCICVQLKRQACVGSPCRRVQSLCCSACLQCGSSSPLVLWPATSSHPCLQKHGLPNKLVITRCSSAPSRLLVDFCIVLTTHKVLAHA